MSNEEIALRLIESKSTVATYLEKLDLLENHTTKTQELEKANKEIQRLKEEYMMLQNASDKVEEELQQRIDKAIEYINNHIARDFSFYLAPNQYLDLRNILQGSDKE